MCHDPPVLLKQSETIGEFLHEVFRTATSPNESLVDDVHEDRLHDVWRSNPRELSFEQASDRESALSEFASGLGEGFTFFDLRQAPVGMGFAWGRHGPETVVVRHEREPIFAVAAPERKPGRLRRLFGQ